MGSRSFRTLPAVVTALFAAGCSGGGHAASPVPPVASTATPVASKAVATGNATFQLSIPSRPIAARLRRNPSYVSPSTQSMTIGVNAATAVAYDLSSSSVNCVPVMSVTTCSVAVKAPVGNDTFRLTLYDGTGASGNVLSATTMTQSIVAGANTVVPLILDGVVDHIAIAPSVSAVAAGATTSIPFNVNAFDAQNNVIVSPGSYIDVNGNALTINLSAAQTQPSVQSGYAAGTATLNTTTVTAPSASVSMAYDGKALFSTQFTATVTGGATIAAAQTTLSVTPTVYEYPASSTNPQDLAVGPDHRIWVTLFDIGAVENFAAAAPGATVLGDTVLPLPIDVNSPWALGINPGSDGNMWIASWGQNVFVCPVVGACVTSIPIYMADHPAFVIDGGDGNMYVNQSYYTGPYRYAISTQSFAVDFFDIGGGGKQSIGPDGRVWSPGGQAGCCFTPLILALPTITSADQSVTQVYMGGLDVSSTAVGSDNNIWFDASAAGTIGHLTSLSATSITGPSFAAPGGTGLAGMARGPDGAIYVLETAANKIARVPSTATQTSDVTEFPVLTAGAGLKNIITGPDGNMWFLENTTAKIGKLAL